MSKRYTAKCLDINAWYVERDDGETIVYDLFKCDAEAVANELNSQDKRIEELEHECNYLQDMLDDCICTKKENKDLKDDIKELRDKNIRLEDKLFLFPSKGKIIRDEHDV